MSHQLCGPWVSPRALWGREELLGLPFLWDTEARDVVAQRPGKICAVKLVMSEAHGREG